MGARIIKRAGTTSASRRRESRTILGALLAVIGPLVLVFLLVAADLRQDLSEARPRRGATLNGSMLIGWRPLAIASQADRDTILRHGPDDGAVVALLGYMMDGKEIVPELTRVTTFTLMPDAGSWIHAAHREPDEMVEIMLIPGTSVLYTDRRLIGVIGRFRHLRSKLRFGEALYGLEDARITDASEKDLVQWFLP